MQDEFLDKVLFILFATFFALTLVLIQFYSAEWKEFIQILFTVMGVVSFLLSLKEYFKKNK
jgi:preprotein translocase subunit SecG